MNDASVREPTDFFHFLAEKAYRLNRRYEHIIWPIEGEIKNARVLDLGSHDGRWPYAIAAAGAKEVVGIEGRPELVAEYDSYPSSEFKGKVRFIVGDYLAEMDRLLAANEKFDIVFCLGVFYHTMHHYRMLTQMRAFEPKIIVIDSIFSLAKTPSIVLLRNATNEKMNAIAEMQDQPWIPAGTPSIPAVELMANSLGLELNVVPWNVPAQQRQGISDYFFKFKLRRRMTVLLRPKSEFTNELAD
jgi:hypothetical protein